MPRRAEQLARAGRRTCILPRKAGCTQTRIAEMARRSLTFSRKYEKKIGNNRSFSYKQLALGNLRSATGGLSSSRAALYRHLPPVAVCNRSAAPPLPTKSIDFAGTLFSV